jgi:hypothetical protein
MSKRGIAFRKGDTICGYSDKIQAYQISALVSDGKSGQYALTGFHAQMKCEGKNEWTRTAQIRPDLQDFGIPFDLENIKSKSDYTFKNLVKSKGKRI